MTSTGWANRYKTKLDKLLPEAENVACRSMLTPPGGECCTRLGARHRRQTPTIVGRGTWEVKRGARGAGREDSDPSSVKLKGELAVMEKRQNEANSLGC